MHGTFHGGLFFIHGLSSLELMRLRYVMEQTFSSNLSLSALASNVQRKGFDSKVPCMVNHTISHPLTPIRRTTAGCP